MIELKGITKNFGKKTAVDHLNLTLEPGTITGFIGPNGAGKTTTIRMLCGITRPDEGEVLINGYDMHKDPIRAKEEFGYISDNPDLFTALKGIEYINFICDIYRVPQEKRTKRLEELLDTFEMRDA
uniref:ATP-binding cassette domain-containing protein n=1 Tax=uncultured Levyella sp. TaxID=1715800 RepID=UPI00258BB678